MQKEQKGTKIETKTYVLYLVSILIIASMFLFIATNKTKITGKAIAATCPDDNTVFKISALTNAHAGTWDGSGYANKVCSTASSGHACRGYNVVARLSSTNNAHLEKKGLATSSYSDVCFGDLTCHYYNGSGSCDSGECLATISADTNAHVGNCSAYTTKICCGNSAPRFSLDTKTAFTILQGNALNYQFNATDEEGGIITFSDNTTLFDINSNTGIVSFTPSATLKGTFSVRITAGDDKGANESIIISLTITDKNFPPIITSFTPEDLTIKLEAGYDYQFTYQANDPDGTIPSSNWLLDQKLKSINKTFAYSPSNSDIGKHTLKLIISDGLLNGSLEWDITVIPENHAPVLKSSIPSQELQQNSKKEKAFDLDDYFIDEDGDKLVYSSKGNKEISVKINFADNTVAFTTPNNWYGAEYVIFTADDGNLIATSNNITLNVKGAAIIPQPVASCAPSWSCTAWEPANCPIAEQQARECQDLNNCGVAAGKPAETQACKYIPSCEDNIKNQGEEGIDCGGPCKACTPGLSPARKFQWYWWMLPFVLVMLLITTIVYEAYNKGAKHNTAKKQELMQAYAPSAAKQREREVQHYIGIMLSKGFPEESIRKRLQQEGWPPAALSRIFGFVELHKRAEGKQPIINRLVKQKESIAEQKEKERIEQREELFKKFER